MPHSQYAAREMARYAHTAESCTRARMSKLHDTLGASLSKGLRPQGLLSPVVPPTTGAQRATRWRRCIWSDDRARPVTPELKAPSPERRRCRKSRLAPGSPINRAYVSNNDPPPTFRASPKQQGDICGRSQAAQFHPHRWSARKATPIVQKPF